MILYDICCIVCGKYGTLSSCVNVTAIIHFVNLDTIDPHCLETFIKLRLDFVVRVLHARYRIRIPTPIAEQPLVLVDIDWIHSGRVARAVASTAKRIVSASLEPTELSLHMEASLRPDASFDRKRFGACAGASSACRGLDVFDYAIIGKRIFDKCAHYTFCRNALLRGRDCPCATSGRHILAKNQRMIPVGNHTASIRRTPAKRQTVGARHCSVWNRHRDCIAIKCNDRQRRLRCNHNNRENNSDERSKSFIMVI